MKINKAILLILICIILVWIFSSVFKKDTYIGFYYPDASNLFVNTQSEGQFYSLDQCRNWINEQKTIYNPKKENLDDYECGKNCDLQNGNKPYVCEETLE